VRSRTILTVAAASAAAWGGGAAPAGAAAATKAPPATTAPEAGPLTAVVGVAGAQDALDVANNWCVAPLRWSGPLLPNLVPAPYQACRDVRAGGENGLHVLDNLCVAPISFDGPLGSRPAPSSKCGDGDATGPAGFGDVSVLRGFSVAGVQPLH
jgi:hypothetical protein